MRTLLRLRPWLSVPIALLGAIFLLSRGTHAFAEGEKPAGPPATGPGMDEPSMGDSPAPAMGDDPAMGDAPAGDGDEEDSDTPVSLADKVKKVTEKGVKWLKQAQLPNGSWGDIGGKALRRPSKEQVTGAPIGERLDHCAV